MTQHTIRVLEDGRHHVGATENGIAWRPIGVSFKSPRDAVDFVDRLAAGQAEAEAALAEDRASRPASAAPCTGPDSQILGGNERQQSGSVQDVSGRPATPAVTGIPPDRGGRPRPSGEVEREHMEPENGLRWFGPRW